MPRLERDRSKAVSIRREFRLENLQTLAERLEQIEIFVSLTTDLCEIRLKGVDLAPNRRDPSEETVA